VHLRPQGHALTVHVVTDSSGYLPDALVAELGITVVSLYYALGDNGLRRELSLDDVGSFFDELAGADEVATTSPPSREDFVATYQPLLQDGGAVVSIHLSSGMSETCSVARQAAEQLTAEGRGGERIVVIDSAGACGQLGLVVLAAARAAITGDLEAVTARARDARHEARVHFLLDTLEYLRRGGRIGTAAAWMGSALSVKPILTIESEIKAVERVRTRERGVERLVEYGRQRAGAGATAWGVQHTRAPEEARILTERLQEVFWRPPEFVSELGPVIGTHTGPGLLAIAGMPARLLD
jgi:DegV family protein with EDD domain